MVLTNVRYWPVPAKTTATSRTATPAHPSKRAFRRIVYRVDTYIVWCQLKVETISGFLGKLFVSLFTFGEGIVDNYRNFQVAQIFFN